MFVALGVFGSGYVIYKLHDAHRRRISDLERQLEGERQVEELVKAQYGFLLCQEFHSSMIVEVPEYQKPIFFSFDWQIADAF